MTATWLHRLCKIHLKTLSNYKYLNEIILQLSIAYSIELPEIPTAVIITREAFLGRFSGEKIEIPSTE